MGTSLVDIVTALREAMFEVEEAEGEIAPELEQELDALEVAFEEKVDRCLLLAQELDAQSAVHKERADIQARAARVLANQAARLREYVKGSMVAAGVVKLPTETFPKCKLAKTPPRVEVDLPLFFAHDPDPMFVRYRDPEPDKKAIKEALAGGVSIPGAALTEPGWSLRWK